MTFPDACVQCGHVGCKHTDEFGIYARCEVCSATQPRPEPNPCDWCGEPSCGESLGKPFCLNHFHAAFASFLGKTLERRYG
jgi:hypothetical protein